MEKASNNQIKLLRKLSRKKYREKEAAFIVEGERAVEQILKNGLVEVESIFVTEGKELPPQYTNLAFFIDESVLEEVSDTETPQGILAICKIPNEIQPGKLAQKSGIIVATDAIQDPGNMGTILRTAAWFGAKAILAGKGSVDIYHPKVVRSTAGATGSVPVFTGDLEGIFNELENAGWQILLLDGGPGSNNLGSVQPTPKTILVVGNEGNGISDKLLHSGREKVKIESVSGQHKVESLNAAVALSIALWRFVTS